MTDNRQIDCKDVSLFDEMSGVTFTGTAFKLDLGLNGLVRQAYLGVTNYFDHWRS